MDATVRGSIPVILRNDHGLYQSTLVHYFRVIVHNAGNLSHPYHNFRHMFHVTWLCHEACLYYRDVLTPRQMRNLLVAALFHDYDHSGKTGPDQHNIDRAIAGLRTHHAPEDAEYLSEIEALIRATHFPYNIPVEELDLCGKIIRDADMGQAFSVAWIQQVVIGLGVEWGKSVREVLDIQPKFLANLTFYTEWGRRMFPRKDIDAKIAEARELAALL
ncbi:MAG TPA: HD domain-containing protein [Candidatus Paceibacterota bacterium]|nr:HD domain-containing protein [Candidatus Paceibacterota bacterium]